MGKVIDMAEYKARKKFSKYDDDADGVQLLKNREGPGRNFCNIRKLEKLIKEMQNDQDNEVFRPY